MSLVAYAWRVMREDDTPTSVVLTLSDAADAKVVSLVRRAAERNGVKLEPIHLTELIAGEHDAIDDARRLVAKIQAEETRGTPVHPAGHPDCPWTLANGGYPAEYAALAHALEDV